MDSSSAASSFDDFILQEILSRLPARSLGRMKCTCKRWNQLISSSLFVTAHAMRSTANVFGMFNVSVVSPGGKLNYLPLNSGKPPNTSLGLPPGDETGICLRAASNGLLFCKLNTEKDYVHVQYYILSNPATKTYCRIPEPSVDGGRLLTHFSLAYELLKPTSELKIVACTAGWDQRVRFEIYSHQTQTWQHVSGSRLSCPSFSKMFDSVCSVYFNSAVHWLLEKGGILAFNVTSKRAYILKLPDRVDAVSIAGYSDSWLGVVRSRMCVVKFDGGICVWEMTDYKRGTWELKKRVHMASEDVRTYGYFMYYRRNVPLFYNGDLCVLRSWGDERQTVRRRSGGVAVYRFATRSWDQVRELLFWMDGCRHFCPYISHMIPL